MLKMNPISVPLNYYYIVRNDLDKYTQVSN